MLDLLHDHNGPVHRIIGRVPAADIVDTLAQRHGLAGWPGAHVGEGERVHHRPLLDREGGRLVDQATLLGLKPRLGVMCDQTYQALLALGAQKPSPSTGWKPSRFSDAA
jgi:hypothetical protein